MANEWQDGISRMINITGGTDATDSDLASYLEANATQYAPYTITQTLTDLTHGNISLTVTAASGHALPSSSSAFTVTGGSVVSYNSSTGVLVVTGSTTAVEVACVAVYSITATITNGSTTGATSITADGTAQVTIVPDSGYALPSQASDITVVGATISAYDDTTGVVTLSAATGNVTLTATCEADTPAYPTKGDIINIDMDGDGTDEQYLVLKSVGSDNVVEVLARATPTGGTSKSFTGSGNTYGDSTLDIFFRTYYTTLSADAQAAIVYKTFRQDSWYLGTSGNPDYNGNYSSNKTAYQVSLGNASFGNEISRRVYALSIQDIIDYLEVTTNMTSENTTLNTENIQAMFNITSGNIWLRSAYAGSYSTAMCVDGDNGKVSSSNAAVSAAAARPALCIDLSQIDWSKAV